VSKDLGRLRDDGGFELRTSAFARLRAQEVQRVGLQAAAVRTPFHAVAVGERVHGRVGETIEASGARSSSLSAPTECLRCLGHVHSRTSVEGISGAMGLVVGCWAHAGAAAVRFAEDRPGTAGCRLALVRGKHLPRTEATCQAVRPCRRAERAIGHPGQRARALVYPDLLTQAPIDNICVGCNWP